MTETASALVDTVWLQRHLRDPSLLVCDVTAAMPGEDFDPASNFVDGHIPGAFYLDLEHFADPDTPLPHMVPSAGRFARQAGMLGIAADTTLVFYESRRAFAAPRAWFLFRLFGSDRVHVLDGGLPSWRQAGGPIETGLPAERPPMNFIARFRAALLAGLGDIERLAAGDAIILDARSAARFDGTAPEPRPGVRSGHIPGSQSLPYAAILQEDGRFRAPDDLRALFAGVGVTADRPVITSCGTGVTAAILTLGLHVAGVADSRLFDGSWTEYALAHSDAG